MGILVFVLVDKSADNIKHLWQIIRGNNVSFM
jgi:hypothetical protein